MTVYIDQYIITNLCMNYIVLSITKMIIKTKITNLRLFISALTGTVFSVLILLPQFYFFKNIMCIIALSITMVIIAYGTKQLLKKIIVFYLSAFLTGGCGFAIQNFLHINNFSDTAYILFFSVLFSYIALNTIISIYEYYKIDKLTHRLTVKSGTNKFSTDCFYDTGNNLTDPITKLPVIIVSFEIVKNLLPPKLTYLFENEQDILRIYLKNNSNIKLKLIPFYTISDEGFIAGFIPDEILIDNKPTNAIIGISPRNFKNHKKYKAIANPIIQ